jgi:phage gpG-like protein
VVVAISDEDLGWKRIKRELKSLNNIEIRVGINQFASRAGEGLSVAEYAYANEFGTDNIPARPFISTAFDENLDKLKNKIQSNISAVFEDQKTLQSAISEIAYLASGDIVRKIDSIFYPPNSPATIKRKGSSKPLIDSGRMRASISPFIKWA